jgi:hypothetical protein
VGDRSLQGLPPEVSSTQKVIIVAFSQKKKTVKMGLNKTLFWLILGKWCKVNPAT